MFIILSYDIEEKRVGKASKIAKKYLYPMQRSLFHGNLTEKKLSNLKNEFMNLIDPEKDSLIIYKLLNENSVIIEEAGIMHGKDTFII